MTKTLIVGGSSGIGLDLARQLIERGHQVSIWSRREPDRSIGSFSYTPVDVTASSPFPEVSELDQLVYCPGNIRLKPFRSLKDEDFMEDLQLNLMGAVRSIRHVLPALLRSPAASIVLFSTVAVRKGMPFHASIASAKGAIEGLTLSLAAEFAPKVRVNCIAPSLTETPLSMPLLNNEAKRAASVERHPLKKIGTVRNISSLAAFLLSEDAGFTTGQVWNVDGGLGSL